MSTALRLRKVLYAAVLVATPWTPGLGAYPLLSTSTPAQDPAQASPVGAAAAAVVAPPRPAVPPAAGDAGAAPAPRRAPAPAPEDPERQDVRAGALWIDVSLAEQRVRVFRGDRLVRDMPASTGLPTHPTPTGSFRIENRGEWFFSEKYRQGGWWWVSFLNHGEYLFHSVPTDRQRRILPEEAARLGRPASHGCVRLSLEDARWVYDHVPVGTRVEIHP